MQHGDIWRGLDLLAERNGLTASALARLAGLDATAFNKSKRMAKDGRPRWPSTESISRALDAVGVGFDDFAALVANRRGMSAPLIGFAQAGSDGFFVEADEGLYALEISGNSMEPAYRAGDRIIVSPSAQVRNGDRIVAKTADGEVMAKVLGRRSQSRVELLSINEDHAPRIFEPAELAWIARILWVSQ